jgi:hypothetical protein
MDAPSFSLDIRSFSAEAAPELGMCCPVLFTDARNAYGLASDCPRESSTNS